MNQYHILILEDDSLTQRVIAEEITHYPSFIPIFASSYTDAVKELRRRRSEISFALIDLNIPDASIKHITSMINTHKLPSIIYSGKINKDLKDLVYEKYVYDYVVKGNKKSLHYPLKRIESYLKTHKGKLLVVDDSKMARTATVAHLEDINIEVIQCENGEEALKYVEDESNNISMIITDYQMPKIDGLELTMRVRSYYNKDELAIIAVSSSDDRETINHFLQVGANDFIIKPLDPEEVKVKVRSHLEFLDLFQMIRELANRDFLTGAYNRRYFFDSATAIVDKNLRKDKPLAVAILDIDRFKTINDTYGHEVGDVAIKEISNVLSSNLRQSDLAARFAGEEFAILLEDISLEDTKTLFEKIRKAFEENSMKLSEQVINYTVSFGVYYSKFSDIDKALAKADEALYRAKEEGRNRVIFV